MTVYVRSMALKITFVVSCFMIVVTIPGCGGAKSPMGKVSGKVTYKGQPVTKGVINFLPEDKEERAAAGTIGADGRYTLTTYKQGDGAALGRHQVSIVSRDTANLPGGSAAPTMTPQEIMKSSQSPENVGKKTLEEKGAIPARYSQPDTSGLSFVVKAGSNTYDVDLVD
jgi:hypothetical protein